MNTSGSASRALAAIHPRLCPFVLGESKCAFPFRRGLRGGIAMKDLNSVQLIGRLGQDPEVQYSDKGAARTTFSVATNRSWTDVDGQAQTETEWTRCVSWGALAEIGGQYLHQGSRVY